MHIKITYTFIAFLFILGKITAQTGNLQQSPIIDVVASDSEINLSTAEFQSLIEEIMQFKRKRQAHAASIALAQYRQSILAPANSPNNPDTINRTDQSEAIRIAQMEKLILEMKEQLKQKDIAPAANENLVEKNDLRLLELKLSSEIAAIKKAVYEAALHPPSITIDTEDQEKQEAIQRDYYFKYATQMIQMRRAIDSLSWRINQRPTTNEYNDLAAQLNRIEARLQSPIVVQSANNPNGEMEKILIPNDNTDYLDAQFKDIRRMIEDLESQQAQQVPIIVQNENKEDRSTSTLDNKAMMDQWNTQVAELKAMIAELKTIQSKPVTTPVPATSNPEKTAPTPVEKEIVYVEVPGEVKYVEVPGEVKTVDRIERIIAGNEKRKLFYDNNATEVKAAYQYILEETASILKNSPELDIILMGYASNKGSVSYNKTLSQKRAETVKDFLINKGISANRIIAQYQGVDYTASDPANGRRVDMVLVRK